jgi:hypothetical protein
MPDALRDALAYQADNLAVPPPDVEGIIRRSRRRTVRGRLAVAGSAAVAAAVVAAGAALFAAPDSDSRQATSEPPAPSPSLELYQRLGPFAAGDTVYAGRATASVTGLSGLYASAHAAVFKTDVDAGSSGAHDVVSSLTTDGVVHRLGETGFDTIVGVDPGSDLVAFTEPARDPVGGADAVDIVIANAVDGSEVARTTLQTGRFEGWDTPPASIDGTTAYVETTDGWYAWDFSSDQPPALVPNSAGAEIAGGVMAQWTGYGPVLDFYRLSDGSKMSSAGLNETGSLSPDGRYYAAVDGPGSPYYLDTETGHRLDGPNAPWFSFEGLIRQWSPSGNLVVIQFGAGGPGYDFTTCAMPSGPCRPSDFSIDHFKHPPISSGQTLER